MCVCVALCSSGLGCSPDGDLHWSVGRGCWAFGHRAGYPYSMGVQLVRAVTGTVRVSGECGRCLFRPAGVTGVMYAGVCSARWRGLCAGREIGSLWRAMRYQANPFEDHRSLALPSGNARCTPHRSRACRLHPVPPQCSGQLTRQLHSVAPSGAWVWVGEVSPAGPHAMCTTPPRLIPTILLPMASSDRSQVSCDHVHYVTSLCYTLINVGPKGQHISIVALSVQEASY